MKKYKKWAAVLAFSSMVWLPQAGWAGDYLTGDFHNHTTFSDGSTSTRTLTDHAVNTFGLDWFAQSGHGGRFSRDGRVDDPEYDGSDSGEGAYWIDDPTIPLKGDWAGTGYGGKSNMWRWQSLQEYQYEECYLAGQDYVKPIWVGLEWQVPGHEHCSTGIISEQFADGMRNADAMAQFEYLFDMEDNDTSGGLQGWTGKIPNPPKDAPGAGVDGHAKAVAAIGWLQANYPRTSYAIPAHIERKGAWSPDKGGNNTGYNVEHFRDFNNAGPDVCFGYEGQPGHQASGGRGGFGTGAFGGTFGGTGYYSAVIGNMWDALLGEGRNWFMFASSDWHNRGAVVFDDPNPGTTNDFWPGEYQKDYVYVENNSNPTVQDIVDGLRSGNSYIVQGDLIDKLEFTVTANGREATMGETLKIKHGGDITITIRVRDPNGTNNCPYDFANPSLAQVGISQPLNAPLLSKVDLIAGDVSGKIAPSDPNYTNPTNPTAHIEETFDSSNWTVNGEWLEMSYTISNVQKSMYFRLRGSNMPAALPNETDADGNPLADTEAGNITYVDPADGTSKSLNNDVEAWADLWFYSNPVFVSVTDYFAGDFHNHTTFSDGSTSTRTLTDHAVNTFGLDWFAQSGHGGRFSRDGRVDDPEYDGSDSGEGAYWIDDPTIPLKGDWAGTGYGGKSNMWRWQSLQEYQYEECYLAGQDYVKPIWVGLEWQVPGHEHCSTGIISEQFADGMRNADAMAQFEYLFDMEDNDTSGGLQGWTGKIPNPPKDAPGAGVDGHAKAVAAIGWLQANYPRTSYAIPAHIERKGAWSPDKGGNNTGYNVEHFRDFNNAGPDVCFGYEGQPGHQASGGRGGFGTGAFGGTFGGTGYYSAVIGNMWDALLGEGRNWFMFASSDWHNRGAVVFDDPNPGTTNDFWPGEYQKDYVYVENNSNPTVQDIVDGLRSGNSYIVQGDLIDKLEFTVTANGREATMGETLKIKHGGDITITIRVRDPNGTNNCPYDFANPSLAQVGISQPLNAPLLSKVDLIAGDVSGKIAPSDPNYTNPTNPTAHIEETFDSSNWTVNGEWLEMSYTISNVQKSMYFRLRGSNMPAAVPNETDADGNPLADTEAGNITYVDPADGTSKSLNNDVEAWADLWFYSNPIFVTFDVEGDLNGDGVVDRDDVRLVMYHRGQPASSCPDCDLDGDGEIGSTDARGIVLLTR